MMMTFMSLEFRSVFCVRSVRSGFCGGRKTGEPGEKPLERGQEPTTNSTHIMMLGLGIKPRRHQWDASALATVPLLLWINL